MMDNSQHWQLIQGWCRITSTICAPLVIELLPQELHSLLMQLMTLFGLFPSQMTELHLESYQAGCLNRQS